MKQPLKSAHASSRGFSLAELILATALLGILGVAAITKIANYQPAQVNVAARQIQSDIEYAKQNAMMTGQTSGVYFKKNLYYVVYQGTTDTPLAHPLTKEEMHITLSDTYPNVDIDSAYTVEFDSFGAPVTGGGGWVKIGDGTNTKTIEVTANTGMVKIQ